jgi:mycobactin salicyl-AMP ligase
MADELVRTHPMRIITELPTESARAAAPSVAVDTASRALMLVSGGTTGAPKLIPRTPDDYFYNFAASAELCGLTGDDVHLVARPAAHKFPLACPGLLGAMSVGATTVSPRTRVPRRHSRRSRGMVSRSRHWCPRWPSCGRRRVSGSLSGRRPYACYGSAAPSWGRTTPNGPRSVDARVAPGVDMAEGLLNYTRLGDPADIVDNTQGRPLSEHDELRVVDENGDDVAPGEQGELLVWGPYTLKGYFNARRANERSFSPQGFYRTGVASVASSTAT